MINKWLDDLCEEYEQTWTRGDSSISGRIRRFLEAKELPQDRQTAAFQALAEIDVERDWQWWRKWLRREIDKRPESEILLEFSRNTRIEQLQEAASPFGIYPESLCELFAIEYRARREWGDDPHPNAYANHTYPPSPTSNFRHRVTLRTLQEDQCRDVALNGLTEFGRQRTRESTSVALLSGHVVNRIAIAERTDARFNRRQFLVQILSPEYAHVTNLSSLHPLAIRNDVMLLQEQCAIVAFPFRIRFLGVSLEFV